MKSIFKIVKVLMAFVVLLAVVYFFGPKVAPPDLEGTLPEVTTDLMALEQQITQHEKEVANLKADNGARIIWYDSIPQKTPYSIVYLHGWSASQKEGDPLHIKTAKRYGCNLFLPRLSGHGLNEKEPMLTITADAILESAREALAIGRQLGDRVILMGTSTGATLALQLAAEHPDIAALMLYSPNVALYDPNATLLTKPWGLQLAKLITGADYHEFDPKPGQTAYWTTKYRIEALPQLQALIDQTMLPETFKKVQQPVFMGYFYKNDSIQDQVISVPAALKMFEDLGTSTDQKYKVAFPNVNDHVITCSLTSEDVESVQKETFMFIERVLGL